MLDHGRWFSPGTPASSTTKTGRHGIVEILLKVALNTINHIKSDHLQLLEKGCTWQLKMVIAEQVSQISIWYKTQQLWQPVSIRYRTGNSCLSPVLQWWRHVSKFSQGYFAILYTMTLCPSSDSSGLSVVAYHQHLMFFRCCVVTKLVGPMLNHCVFPNFALLEEPMQNKHAQAIV